MISKSIMETKLLNRFEGYRLLDLMAKRKLIPKSLVECLSEISDDDLVWTIDLDNEEL